MEKCDYVTQLKGLAEYYVVARGWSVIPLVWCDKQPDRRVLPVIFNKQGKRVASWEPFQERTPIEWERKKWFGHQRNIGIVTGRVSGLLVVDCDNEAARNWLDQRGLLSGNVPTVKTSKGWHFYFAYPDGATIGNRAGMFGITGLDMRGQGGMVVAPPSIHPSGFMYRWEAIPEGLPTLPAWFFEKQIRAATLPAPTQASGSHIAGRTHTYAERVLSERLAFLRSTGKNRNNELNRTAYILGQLIGLKELDRAHVERELWNAALSIGLDESEIGKTILSGVSAGIRDKAKLAEFREMRRLQWLKNKGLA